MLRIQAAKSAENLSHQYYQDLLQLVVEETQAEYGPLKIDKVASHVTQSRGFSMLNHGELDVFWAGTNTQRELDFNAIRIPAIGGLLGVRIPVIRKDSLDKFNQITQPYQLKQLVACQGAQWPDSDILQENGYRVERIITFNLMYTMLDEGRCDYFPRGLNEGYAEVKGLNNPNLMAFDKILLRYHLPMYFFTSKQNTELNERLTKGLTQLVDSGRLLGFMQQHPTTAEIFPLSRFKSSTVFELYNSSLPSDTPVSDPKLWMSLTDQPNIKVKLEHSFL
ncbi:MULTISPECIES: hypothetical protein [Shewanella]|uniref:hypothetical protein n=1 Tax=Shewanella TaxID=22 RepID=UPI001F5F3491|nr:hypothetical protein [Shewanella maritima]